jgi:LacI family transcriptional regulator
MVATVVWPQLTTVRQPIKNMAATAVEILIEQCRDQSKDEVKNRQLPIEIVMRESTTSN